MGNLQDECSAFLYTKSEGDEFYRALEYLTNVVARPDKGSEFDKNIGLGKYAFRIPVVSEALIARAGLAYLATKGYDVLLLDHDREIIGHSAFQVHPDDSLHVFAVSIKPEYRGKKLAHAMHVDLVHKARDMDVKRMRLGAGGQAVMTRILEGLKRKEQDLGISVEQNNWLSLTQKV